MKSRSRKLKVVALPKEVGAELFHGRRPGDTLAVPWADALPADAEIGDVIYDEGRQAFGLVVWHESFGVVKDGDPPPWVELDLPYLYRMSAPRQTAEVEVARDDKEVVTMTRWVPSRAAPTKKGSRR